MSASRPLLAAALLAVAAASAQPAVPGADENTLRAFATQHVAAQAGDRITRFEVRLHGLDALAQAAPCRRAEPFLPPAARLWGRSSVGVRCVEGAHWAVLVPLTVAVWGPAVVAAQPLAAGAVLAPEDLREQEVELTRETGALVRDAQQLAGRTLVRAVAAGQPLRVDAARQTAVVQAGDPVRLRLVGAGFAVSASGQALNAAGAGQPVRVRTELGKVLTGVAREGRQVDVAL